VAITNPSDSTGLAAREDHVLIASLAEDTNDVLPRSRPARVSESWLLIGLLYISNLAAIIALCGWAGAFN
jgi:hypothetical protein